MESGDVIGGRFQLEHKVAVGGMAVVYRASDRHDGNKVAIKVVSQDNRHAITRFLREAALLAKLHHPGIVRYIDHGRLQNGDAFLAMEWLDGEDLSHFLRKRRMMPARSPQLDADQESGSPAPDDTVPEATASLVQSPAPTRDGRPRGQPITETTELGDDNDVRQTSGAPVLQPLDIADTIAVGRRLAAAVAELHSRGIVHRDIKPANIFVPERDLGQIKLLDLGTAIDPGAIERITREGAIVGTPQYMAPEQARANGEVTPATDVWAIGCVLYQCITGVKLFAGRDLMAVLASILLDTPKPIDDLRPETPPLLTDLIMHALAKVPDRRPRDARVLLEALEELEAVQRSRGEARRDTPDPGDTGGPRDPDRPGDRLDPDRARRRSSDSLTRAESRVGCMLFARDPGIQCRENDHLLEIAGRYGGKARWLADDSMLISFADVSDPTEQISRAARTALALGDGSSQITLVLATVRVEGMTPAGAAAQRATTMLKVSRPGVIRIDEDTAAVLAARFHIGRDEYGPYLGRERAYLRHPTLLGKRSPWVGRRRELADLLATFDECVADQVARAVLVVAPPGMGKSRLTREVTHELRRRHDDVRIIVGRGDAASTGSPFAILGPALRSLAGILDYEPYDAQRYKLTARLRAVVKSDRVPVLVPLIGALLGIRPPDRPPDEPSATGAENQDRASGAISRRAAEADPVFRAELTVAAVEEWLRAECSQHAVILVLEDLHWGDLPSLRCIDNALAALHDRPFLVLATARPEVHTIFPGLWSRRFLHEVPLHPLSPRQSLALLRSALGAEVSEAMLQQAAALADGNPFYLEELVRTVAFHGDLLSLPETVLGIVQARLDLFGREAKRVLRAASVFGEVFWQGAIEALLGAGEVFEVGEWLDDLARREVIRRIANPRFHGQVEYRFRHALTCDAAYAMLTTDDRRLGHALAGVWLEDVGEHDHRIIAEHFRLGDEHPRAIPHFERAAVQALHGNDLAQVMSRAQQAIDLGAENGMLGQLLTLQTMAAFWTARYDECSLLARAAMEQLTPGTSCWFNAMGHAMVANHRLGHQDEGDRLFAMAIRVQAAPDAATGQLICLCRGAYQLLLDGYLARATPIVEHIVAVSEAAHELDARTCGNLHSTLAMHGMMTGDIDRAMRASHSAIAAFESAADERNAQLERILEAMQWAKIGDFERAAQLGQRNLESSRDRAASLVAEVHQGYYLSYLPGQMVRARALLESGVERCQQAGNARIEGWARIRLADIDHWQGRHRDAEEQAKAAIPLLERSPSFLALALAAHSRALLGQGQPARALTLARRAMDVIAEIGFETISGIAPVAALIRALDASGRMAEAHDMIAEVFRHITAQAARFTNPAWKASFLAIPDNQEIMDLAARRTGARR